MTEWFKNLSNGEKIAIVAIVVPICLAVIGGLFGLLEWPLGKDDGPESKVKIIHQEGSGHTAANIDGHKNIIAGGNVNTGIDSDAALNILVKTSKELGRTEEENIHLRETVRQLEEQLSQQQIIADTNLQQVPQPTQKAKDLAAQIEDDAGPYALALKAIAESRDAQADELLDETQQFLDTVQEQKDRAQIKIYLARMQNASYAGRPQDALRYCDLLKPMAGDDSLILNEIAKVHYENANYKEAEPLARRVVTILENPGGEPLPNYTGALNNLAALLLATNRLEEAEPLMQRVVTIFEKAYGENHPNVATALNNLAQLLKATNRLKEAEPLMKRQLVILLRFTRRTGHPHPNLESAINNYGTLLIQMGESKEQVDARLKGLDPEIF